MKRVRILLTAGVGTFLLPGCILTEDGVGITPTDPSIEVCFNAVSDTEAEEMKAGIEALSFKNERIERAKELGDNRCFQAHQVVILMEGFTFEDAKLDIAKFLYTRTENGEDYDLVIDALVFYSHRQELRNYINSIG